MNHPIIRSVKEQDIVQLIDLCALHAKYEDAEYSKKGKALKLGDALFKENPFIFCFVAELNNEIVGYTTITKEFSTWDADYFLHMDCLYILERSRGLGLGSLFVEAIKQFSIDASCTHIQWQTPIDNSSAIGFYTNLGAISKNKKRFYLKHDV